MGVGTSALAQALGAARAILLVPFFLRAWGPDVYGHWIALTALASNVNLLDLGGQNYIANLLAVHHSRGEEDEFRARLSEGVSLFLLVGVGFFLVATILLTLFCVVTVPGLARPLARWEAGALWFLGANGLLLSVPGGVYVTVYRATGRYTRGEMAGNIGRLTILGVLLLALVFKVAPLAFAAWTFGVSAVVTFAYIWDTRRHIPGCVGLAVNLEYARRGCAHLSGSLYFWIISIAQTIRLQGALLIVAATSPAALVAVYATHRTLAAIPGYVGALVQGPLVPELTFLWAHQQFDTLLRATFVVIRTISVACGAAAVFLWIAAPLVYTRWTGEQLEIHKTLMALLLVQAVLAAGWSTSTWALLAANEHRPVAGWLILNGVITIALGIVLAHQYGATGVAAAGVTADLLCGVGIMPRVVSSFLKVPPRRVYLGLLAAASAPLVFITVAVVVRLVLQGWWTVAGFIIVSAALVYPTLMFVVGTNKPGRAWQLLRAIRPSA